MQNSGKNKGQSEKQPLTVKDIKYGLKAACKDCPFKRTVPHHDGVATSLLDYQNHLDEGRFGHTCHKTDPRSDGFEESYEGDIQHCAGALIMLKNMGYADIDKISEKNPLFYPLITKRLNVEKLEDDPDVFKDFNEMKKHYIPHLQKLKKQAKERGRRHTAPLDGGGWVSVTYRDPEETFAETIGVLNATRD